MKLGPCLELLSFVTAWICGLAIATGVGREAPRQDRIAERGPVLDGHPYHGRLESTAMK